MDQIVSETFDKEATKHCDSFCASCMEQNSLCEDCEHFDSIYPQLRPCKRCVIAGVQCKKLAVLAVSMDCESNNANAMKQITANKDQLPPHMRILHGIPDAVHTGKKVFRASANWWLWSDGHRVSNTLLCSLRQFDDIAGPKLRAVISDSDLRNRDRMDYGAILAAVDPSLHAVVNEFSDAHGSLVTTTLFPDPFWKSKGKGVLSSLTDICEGKHFIIASFIEKYSCLLYFSIRTQVVSTFPFFCYLFDVDSFGVNICSQLTDSYIH